MRCSTKFLVQKRPIQLGSHCEQVRDIWPRGHLESAQRKPGFHSTAPEALLCPFSSCTVTGLQSFYQCCHPNTVLLPVGVLNVPGAPEGSWGTPTRGANVSVTLGGALGFVTGIRCERPPAQSLWTPTLHLGNQDQHFVGGHQLGVGWGTQNIHSLPAVYTFSH